MIAAMNFDVIIIGGGLVGASPAVALRHSGLSPAFEARGNWRRYSWNAARRTTAALRNAGLAATNRLTTLKKMLVQHTLKLT